MPIDPDGSWERDRRREEFWHDVERDDRRRLTRAAVVVLTVALTVALVAFTALAWWVVSGA